MHSYECGKYTGLVNSNWNFELIHNSLGEITIHFDRTAQFSLFVVGHVSFQDSSIERNPI
jgi:hypothetical protein